MRTEQQNIEDLILDPFACPDGTPLPTRKLVDDPDAVSAIDNLERQLAQMLDGMDVKRDPLNPILTITNGSRRYAIVKPDFGGETVYVEIERNSDDIELCFSPDVVGGGRMDADDASGIAGYVIKSL